MTKNSLLSGKSLVGNSTFSTEKSIFILGYIRNHGGSGIVHSRVVMRSSSEPLGTAYDTRMTTRG